MKKFKDTYELLKEHYFKAGVNPHSTEAEIAKLNRELKSILVSENQDKVKEESQKLKEENESLKGRVGYLEEMMVKLSGGRIKLPSTASSSSAMDVDPQEPSAQGLVSPGLKRKKSGAQDDDDQ